MLTKSQKIRKWSKKSKMFVAGKKGNAFPIFIFAEQRSGTNMLVELLNHSLEIECYNENDAEAFDNYVLRENSTIIKLLQKSYAKAVLFKAICDSQRAKELLNAHPGARGIWIFRKYQDAVNSSLRRFDEHRKYLYYMLYEPRKAAWRVENVSSENMQLVRKFYQKEVDDASARALIWYLRNHQFIQQRLDRDERVVLVSYEELVSESESVLSKITDLMGVNCNERWLDFIHGSSIGKEPAQKIDPEINRLCIRLSTRLQVALESQKPVRC